MTASDLGNNFFLDSQSLGKPRAQCVTELLMELNEHVSGSYITDDIADVLSSRPEFLHNFTLVIATQMLQADLKRVSTICAARKLPLIVLHTYGFLGYLRLDLGDHQVVEAHPDHPFPDLRILHPPSALRSLVDSSYADLSALSSTSFSHTPWVVLLIKAVDKWKDANGGALPTTYQQKKEVKAIVQSFRRAELQADQNIEEAVAAVNTALNTPSPSSSVAAILSVARSKVSAIVAEQQQSQISPEEDGATPASAASARKAELAFWLMAAATQCFVEHEGAGLLPLAGTIPDMTADTTTYVALQQLYAHQAAADLTAVQAHAREIAAVEGLAADNVSAEELKRFCKNAHSLQLVTYRSLEKEYQGKDEGEEPPTTLASGLSNQLAMDDPASAASLYLLLRAAQVGSPCPRSPPPAPARSPYPHRLLGTPSLPIAASLPPISCPASGLLLALGCILPSAAAPACPRWRSSSATKTRAGPGARTTAPKTCRISKGFSPRLSKMWACRCHLMAPRHLCPTTSSPSSADGVGRRCMLWPR